MKKLVSALLIATMILSSLILAVSANLSEQGVITIVNIDGKDAADSLTIAKITLVAKDKEEWTKAEVPEAVSNYASTYGSFKLELSEEAKASGKTESKVTISVPGLTAANAPVVLLYNETTKKFEAAKDIKVNGSEVTFNAKFTDGVVKCNVVYKEAATSPATNVPAFAMITVFVVALIGAAYTGKKAFN